jgi:hypothetical protein
MPQEINRLRGENSPNLVAPVAFKFVFRKIDFLSFLELIEGS